jgi:hypothetical protein
MSKQDKINKIKALAESAEAIGSVHEANTARDLLRSLGHDASDSGSWDQFKDDIAEIRKGLNLARGFIGKYANRILPHRKTLILLEDEDDPVLKTYSINYLNHQYILEEMACGRGSWSVSTEYYHGLFRHGGSKKECLKALAAEISQIVFDDLGIRIKYTCKTQQTEQ